MLHVVGHPVIAATLSVGGLSVVMLTSLYDALERYPLLHQAVHLHYLVAGYLFAWSIAGPDPAPKRPGLRVRVTVLIVAAAAHSILAKVLYAQASRLPMSDDHSTGAIQQTSQLMYYAGDLAEILLATALLSTWFATHRATATSSVTSADPSCLVGRVGQPSIPVASCEVPTGLLSGDPRSRR